MSRSRYRLGLALALLLLLALRLSLLRCGPFKADVLNFADEGNYVGQARSLIAGDTVADTALPWMRAPLPAFLLVGLAELRGQPVDLVVCDFEVAQIIIWAGILLLLSTLAAGLFDHRTALVAAFLIALLPETMLLAVLVLSDTLFCAGLLATVAALFAYRRHTLAWLVVAGLLAGLTALARSTMLPLLPVFVGWAALIHAPPQLPCPAQKQRGPANTYYSAITGRWALQVGSYRLRPVPAVALLICCFAVIAPWTLRNYRAFGGLILIDTTGAVVLFANNAEPGGRSPWLQVLNSSTNPVERQRFATRRAWAVIKAHPEGLIAKIARAIVKTWRPEHFAATRDYAAAVAQRPLLGSVLAQLNLLQTMVLLLIPVGLFCAPRAVAGAYGYRAAAVGLAIGCTLMVGMTHFEGRYRLPFLVVLLPYAAWCLAHPRQLLAALRMPAGWWALAVCGALALAAVPMLWPNQWDDARALALYGAGLMRANWGDTAGALADQRAAAALQPNLREARVAAAQLMAQRGDPRAAEEALRAVLSDVTTRIDDAPDAIVTLQQLLQQQGRSAEAAKLDARLSVPARRRAELLAWRQVGAPTAVIQLGRADLGKVQGFYTYESEGAKTFRWSRPEARLLLAGRGQHICLHLNANRPAMLAAPRVALTILSTRGAVAIGEVAPPRQGWAWVCRPLPIDRGDDPIELVIRTPRYNPEQYAGAADTRELGVAVAEARLVDGLLVVDPATGLRLDFSAAPQPPGALELIGMSGSRCGQPGAVVPFTLWWRATQAPPGGTFSFIHLLDASGAQAAMYNAPLAATTDRSAWSAGELVADNAGLALPPTLTPGRYRVVGGSFDPASGAALIRADMGLFTVEPVATGTPCD